jgi:uncharacterized membrane protein
VRQDPVLANVRETSRQTPPPLFGEKRLAWLFLAYALPAVIFHSIVMAPFQVADELSHVFRADQIRGGTLVSTRLGGMVDGGLVAYGAPYQKMWFHPEVKQTAALAREVGAMRWTETPEVASFFNTAQYGPVLYLPQAIGIAIGQQWGFSIARTVVLARLANALVACFIGFWAISICRRGQLLMFAVLLFPMTLSEIGSASQDALIITLSLLAVAIASRALAEGRPASVGEFALFAFIVVATTIARPTQIALVLLAPAYFRRTDSAWLGKVLIGLVAGVPIVYWYSLLGELMPPWPTGVSVSDQFDYLLHYPLALPSAIANSFAANGTWYSKTVVGYLGWTDAPMPGWYYLLAGIVCALALAASSNRGPVGWPSLVAVLTFGALLGAQFGALYLTWTPVAKATIDGFQGRYLLPVLPLLGWMVPAPGSRFERAVGLARWAVLLFPLVTLGVLSQVLMNRYYGSWAGMAEALQALLWQ